MIVPLSFEFKLKLIIIIIQQIISSQNEAQINEQLFKLYHNESDIKSLSKQMRSTQKSLDKEVQYILVYISISIEL